MQGRSSALVALGLEEKDVGSLKTEPIDHDTDREEHSNDAAMTAHSIWKSLLLIQVQWNPTLLSPHSYSHLLITALYFVPATRSYIFSHENLVDVATQ